MRTRSNLQLCFLVGLMMITGVNAQTSSPKELSAVDIVNRYIAARGGLEKIRAIRTMVLRGPNRSDGSPGRYLMRSRPYYFTIGGEGNDGAPWEGYDQYGLRIRVTNAPAAALRHTAYFDDPLVMSLEAGWSVELTGSEIIEGHDAYRLRVVYPDGWVNECFVDKQTWLWIARRFTAPIHAFGEEVTTQAIISNYKESNGVLFPMRFTEYDLATGKPIEEGPGWVTIETNIELPATTFAPPPVPDTPVARLVNSIFGSRSITVDALGWYHDFRKNPATSSIDIEAAIESVGYQCLKNGAVATGLALLEENLAAHPRSAKAHFGLGRAYRAADRESDAVVEFNAALKLDPNFVPAKDALTSRRVSHAFGQGAK